jgi:hypothetical protein
MTGYKRRAVRNTIELVWERRSGQYIAPAPVGATAERIAKGDIVGGRVLPRNVLEEIAAAGDVGEDVAALAAAGEWFAEMAHLAQVRGRLVYSQLVTELPISASAEKARARHLLARVCTMLGHDAWNVLFDALIWESVVRGAERKAMFRMALRALSRILSDNALH